MEDWGSYMSTEAKSFYRAFKNYLKREFPEAELVGFKPNHYDFSGFVVQDGKCIFISHNLYRTPNGTAMADFDDSSFMNGVLYRTALNTKDFSGKGGHNQFTSIFALADRLRNTFDNFDRYLIAA